MMIIHAILVLFGIGAVLGVFFAILFKGIPMIIDLTIKFTQAFFAMGKAITTGWKEAGNDPKILERERAMKQRWEARNQASKEWLTKLVTKKKTS